MGGRPVLFLSYSGVLGGSERVLLDCATRLGRPALVACPEGPLAAAARTAGLAVAPLLNRTLRMRGHRAAALRGLAGLAYDAASLARRVHPPVLVAWGAEDRWIPVDRAHKLVGLVPGARLRVVPDAGHLIQLDAPAALTAALLGWLIEHA